MTWVTERLFKLLDKELRLFNLYLDNHVPINIEPTQKHWNSPEISFKTPSRKAQEAVGRKIARKMMMRLYPEIDWSKSMVHHIDGDAINNDQNNLEIVTRKTHHMVHKYIKTYRY